MRSLTSLIPALAPIFGLTEKSLYERQKSLVRMKMLPTPTGRGRGSGAEATAENVALLIIAVLATDKQADDERVRKLAYAPFVEIPGGASNPGSRKKDRCPWTGATVFKDGLSFILSRAAPVATAGHYVGNAVSVSRAGPNGSIFFNWPKRAPGWSEFRGPDRARQDRLQITAELENYAIQEIRHALLANEGLS